MKNGQLRITIDIACVPSREYPASVNVQTQAFLPGEIDDQVGATWVGLCNAINEYMRSRGAPAFDCLKQHEVDEPTHGQRLN